VKAEYKRCEYIVSFVVVRGFLEYRIAKTNKKTGKEIVLPLDFESYKELKKVPPDDLPKTLCKCFHCIKAGRAWSSPELHLPHIEVSTIEDGRTRDYARPRQIVQRSSNGKMRQREIAVFR
jgi:hypothetical protein